MANLKPVELKTFVPARDFEVSKRFYRDIGFTMNWGDGDIAYFHHENVSFLLQNFYVKELAENLMLHLLVEDVDAWFVTLRDAGIVETYGVKLLAPEQQDWGMRDFVLLDPLGVLWRIAQNTG